MNNPIKVLIVDDNQTFRRLTRALLEISDGITVVGEAKDGLEAIERACELRPNVILLDVSMPRMDGLQAAARISELCPDGRIIMLSTHDPKCVVQKALRNGAWGYLVKGKSLADDIVDAIRVAARGDTIPANGNGKPTGCSVLERNVEPPTPVVTRVDSPLSKTSPKWAGRALGLPQGV